MARSRDEQRESVQSHLPLEAPGDRYEIDRDPARPPRSLSSLRDSELQTLADVGTFRTLALDDLTRHRYAGNRTQAEAEVRNLVRQGFLRVRTQHPAKAVYAALTREGKELLHRGKAEGSRQVYYAQFVKPRELRHAAALYRLYQEVAARIRREGARVRRVVGWRRASVALRFENSSTQRG